MGGYGDGSSPVKFMTGRRRFRVSRWIILSFACVLISGLLWCSYVFWNINRTSTTDPLTGGDAGIILGMSMWGDEPSPGLKERLDYGLKLYEQGKFSRFIVTGGLDKPDFKYTEAEGMRNYLVQQGVPGEDIYVENKATSTYENLLFSKEIMDREGWSTAVIITHTYHGRRAREIAVEIGYDRVELGLTDSKIMSMAWHKSREILAYTKWKGQQLILGFER